MRVTREEAKEMLPIIQAWADGKTVEWYDPEIGWRLSGFTMDFGNNPKHFRIKPEPKYRPFKTRKECWNEMLKHQPFGWVKSPRGELFCIDKVFEEGIVYKHSSCHFNEYLEGQYSFADGTPFGIKEE